MENLKKTFRKKDPKCEGKTDSHFQAKNHP